ncbi:anaerobic sulfite reductase subunit AsrA [Wukongibacter sp. M2B1]|uniref:anaerobic sulfite reductase subunit AsrA n=1 Tax=Wukongibacter sp. M2B1 TaxID=3088895 RepID=UPI003D7B4E48
MGYKIISEKFNDVINMLSQNYKIYGPTRKEGKGRLSDTDVIAYDEITSFDDLEMKEKSYFSPKEVFYPIRETLFYFTEDGMTVPKVDEKPVIIFLRPCDINGIKRLDTIFLKNGDIEDFYYKRLREKVKFFMIECTEGFDTCFCVSMESNKTDNYSVALRFKEGEIFIDIKDKDFNDTFSKYGIEADFKPKYIKENKVKVSIPDPEKVNIDTFENPIWKEYTQRCIACGRCNTSCITCSCFTMQDVTYDNDKKLGERRRRWAGCHVNGFTDMAGGHSFRQKNGDKMRFKTMHKINDFYKRFDYHMCVGCGRCDDVCPEYISFSKCVNKLSQIVEGAKEDE